MCIEADNFLGRTSGLNGTYNAGYSALICGLVADGVWAKFDALYVFNTQDQTTALLSLVSSSYNLTLHQNTGPITFAAGVGFTGVESGTSYLGTGFNPATAAGNYALNSAHMSFWSTTSAVATDFFAASYNASQSVAALYPRYLDSKQYLRLNDSNGDTGATVSSAQGVFVGNRSSSVTADIYVDGSFVRTTGAVSTVLPNVELTLFALNDNGAVANEGGCTGAAASIGSALTATDIANLNSRLRFFPSPSPTVFIDSVGGFEAGSTVRTGVGQRTIWWRPN